MAKTIFQHNIAYHIVNVPNPAQIYSIYGTKKTR